MTQNAKGCRERYYWYKEHGICVSCGTRYAEPGRVRCKQCRAKSAMHEANRRDVRIEYLRKRREERIKNGICTECGKAKAIVGEQMCKRCKAMRRDSVIKYRIMRRMKGERYSGNSNNPE